MKRLLLLPFGLLALATLPAASRGAASPDDEAHFLGDLPVQGAPLEDLTHSEAWTTHAKDFNQAWAELDKRQLEVIQTWAPTALGHLYTDTGPLLYFFSGPDFLYAHAFFPAASTYVLCGIEPIGPLPQVENLPPQTLGASLDSLRDSLDTLLNFSFFITKKMRTQLEDTRLSGTLPLIYIFLARTGCHIRDVSMVALDKQGQFTTGKSLAPAVKIDFTGPSGNAQTLYYFCSDLSDDAAGHSGLLPWCASLGQGTQTRAFLKAASYLMFTGGFDTTRQFLLTHSDALLQDDSGIPMHDFAAQDWTFQLFGAYHGPIATFKQFPQPELDLLMAAQKPAPLPFSVGYRWHPGESSLILATRATRATRATHAATPAPSPAPSP